MDEVTQQCEVFRMITGALRQYLNTKGSEKWVISNVSVNSDKTHRNIQLWNIKRQHRSSVSSVCYNNQSHITEDIISGF